MMNDESHAVFNSSFCTLHSSLFLRCRRRLILVGGDAGRDGERGWLAVLACLRALDERGDFGGVALRVRVVGVGALRASVVEKRLAQLIRGATRVAASDVSLREFRERLVVAGVALGALLQLLYVGVEFREVGRRRCAVRGGSLRRCA